MRPAFLTRRPDQSLLPMLYFSAIALCHFATMLVWWRSDRHVRSIRRWRWATVVVRLALAAFFMLVLLYPSRILLAAFGEAAAIETLGDISPDATPEWLKRGTYIWFGLVLPPTLACMAVASVWRRVRHGRAANRPVTPAAAAEPSPQETLTRRDTLRLAMATVPPLISIGLCAAAVAQAGRFRVRRLTLPVADLPKDLDGLSVVHLSDLHAGNFFPPEAVDLVVAAVHQLKPELVVFTGDLIDRGLLEYVPLGFRMLDPIIYQRRYAFGMIEGNHDTSGNASEFERIVASASNGGLLLDSERIVYPRGPHFSPVQLLGITWGELVQARELYAIDRDPDRTVRKQSDDINAESVRQVTALRRPDAFPILLSHHPHAFDAAAEASLPLTLAGHSHGGQLMASDSIGVGPLRFRYWAGVHQRGRSRLSISNGLGSWYPLRVNAAAEIVHLTLTRET